jgi:hypothetical protein
VSAAASRTTRDRRAGDHVLASPTWRNRGEEEFYSDGAATGGRGVSRSPIRSCAALSDSSEMLASRQATRLHPSGRGATLRIRR